MVDDDIVTGQGP